MPTSGWKWPKMRNLYLALWLVVSSATSAWALGPGPNIKRIIQKSTLTFTAPIVFLSPVSFSTTVFVTGGSSISVVAPLTGDGTVLNPIGVDGTVTLEGNVFNGANQLIKLNGASKYPAADGSLITNIGASSNKLNVVNKSGVTLNIGDVVFVDGAQGGTPTADLAQADQHDTAHAVGVVSESINNNQSGDITMFGSVDGFDTSLFSEGTDLYLSSSIAGKLTEIPPSPEFIVVHLGVVTKSNATTGSMIVMVHIDHAQTGSVSGLTQGVKTNLQLQTEGCATYPAIRCSFYSSDDDDWYNSTGSLVNQFRNTRTGTGPQ